MKTNKFNVLILDIKRAFFSINFIIATLGVTLACFFSMLFIHAYKIDVITGWFQIHSKSQSILCYMFGILPYVMCFYDDMEYKNYQNMCLRINIDIYTFSKYFSCIFSTIIAYTLGKLLFVFLYSLRYPLVSSQFDTLSTLNSFIFVYLLGKGLGVLYFILISLLQGLHCGLLSSIALLFSIYNSNRAVIISVPVAAYYYITNYLFNRIKLPPLLNFDTVFSGMENVLNNAVYSFLYAFLLALSLYIIMGVIITKSIKRRYFNG